MYHMVHGFASQEGLGHKDVPRFYYVFVLRSLRDGPLYVGSTEDLRRRFVMHNAGAVASTRPHHPFELVFYEAYRKSLDAKRREAYFKTPKCEKTLRTMLQECFKKA